MHVPLLLQAFPWQLFMLTSQYIPMYPDRQVHTKPLTSSEHVPLFQQGELEQLLLTI